MKKVCVYCASSPEIAQVYFDATEKLANYFADEGIEVVFGGGSNGLMGRLADVMLQRGGRIKGIMPQFMKDVEWAHKEVKDFDFTDTMHERKQKLMADVDGIVTLAGGCGTWEELMEVLTLKRLGLYDRPIVILNTNHYYDHLEALFEKSIEENFMKPEHRTLYTFVKEPEEVLPALRNTSNAQ